MENYFDAHTHLQMMPDLKKTIENALKKGVCGFICNSTGPDDWDKVTAISLKYSQVIPCYGVHPHYIENLPNDWFENLKLLLQKDDLAMVGEIGLDNLKPNMDNKKIRNISCILLSILITLIGISRIYLGVHYASDVLAGFVLSIAYLICYIIITFKLIKMGQ